MLLLAPCSSVVVELVLEFVDRFRVYGLVREHIPIVEKMVTLITTSYNFSPQLRTAAISGLRSDGFEMPIDLVEFLMQFE